MTLPGILHYSVASRQPRAHLFDIRLRIPDPGLCAEPGQENKPSEFAPRTLRLSLPAWIPGSYMIRDFARHILRVQAQDSSGVIAVEKLDKQSWHLPAARGTVSLAYQVYAHDLSVRGAHLDHTHGYFNGACLFLQPMGYAHWPCELEIERPTDPAAAHWRLATSMTSAGAPAWGFGRYRAENYAELIDHPVEMGSFSLVEFKVRGIPHAMTISGRHQANLERLGQDLTRVCEQQAALFDELPLARYLFLTQVVGDGYGGLEHRASSSLICKRDDLPRATDTDKTEKTAAETAATPSAPSEGYRRFLGLCSHEYFHLWNVKRIRPRVFAEQGLEREVHTRLLWAFEGITSYYDDLALVRAGLISPHSYLGLLANTISRVLRDPGRLRQTLAESSFDAWTKFYQQDANAPNAIVSYYTKGALVALALDLNIRQGSEGRASLDDVMRALWQRHGRDGCQSVGVSEREPETLASAITGVDLRAFFAHALDDTRDLDLAPLFASVGIGMHLRPAKDTKDLGGFCAAPTPLAPTPAIGARFKVENGELKVAAVLNNRPAERAGLAPGDTLIALDGLRVQPDGIEQAIAACALGQPIALHVFRRDELLQLELRPEPAPQDICELYLLPNAPDAAVRARAAWLHSDSDAGQPQKD
jgi:predicted metalloprotease with PDZ domain